jgi:hypothetical protein
MRNRKLLVSGLAMGAGVLMLFVARELSRLVPD